MLPRENLNSIQDLIFILVYKVGLSENEVLAMPRWIAKKRYSQYETYQKAKQAEMKKETSKMPSSSSMRR